jgi:hypothetical protein
MAEYTTVAAAKAWGEFVGDEEDDLINALILSASGIIDQYTHRNFAVANESIRTFRRSRRYDDPIDGPILLLDEDLAEDASLIQDVDDLTWAPTVFYREENDPPYWGIELTEDRWPQQTEVTGYWGYSRTPPPEIEYACLRLVKWLYDLKDTTEGQVPIVTPEGRVLLPQGIPTDIMAIILPFVRQQVGR